MKLEELMNEAYDEVWFCIVTPDEKEHYFWSADFIGWHPDVMPELEPLLDREFEDFDIVMRKNPEGRSKVPMIRVMLLETEENLEKERVEFEKAEEAEKSEKAKKSKAKKRKGGKKACK